MRKIKFFAAVALAICILTTLVLTACSCSWLFDDWLTKNQQEITDEAVGRLCTAVSNRDAEAVKAEFSSYDLKEVVDFDGQVQKLFDYIVGGNITYSRKSSGSDDALMGTYPKRREIGGARYELKTETDEYKVIFSYCSYHSEAKGKVNKEKIGFIHFDIINAKNDRDCSDRLYSGCPFRYNGINFGYKTNYIFCPEEFGCQTAFCEKSEKFDPVIINGVAALETFYEAHKDEYSLERREDGKGFKDVTGKYDEAFFTSHSLYIVGFYSETVKYKYVPQFVYIGDFVLVNVHAFRADSVSDESDSEYAAKGVIKFIELPEKVEDGITALSQLTFS